MEGPDWELLAKKLAKHEGMLKVASILKRAYKRRAIDVIAEFDRFAKDQESAGKFLQRLVQSWSSKPGDRDSSLNWRVEFSDWSEVMNHAKTRFSGITTPRWDDSRASGLLGADVDPHGVRYDPMGDRFDR